MPVSICTQKEFLIESKLNGILGGFVVTLGLSGAAASVEFTHGGVCTCLFKYLTFGGDGGWQFSGRRMWVVECFGPFPLLLVPLLSLYFPYPSDQLSSSRNPVTPSCPLFPTVTTLMHPRPDAESRCSIPHPVAGC